MSFLLADGPEAWPPPEFCAHKELRTSRTAVVGMALPFSLRGPELVVLPTGSAAIRTNVVIMTISRHKYFTATSCDC